MKVNFCSYSANIGYYNEGNIHVLAHTCPAPKPFDLFVFGKEFAFVNEGRLCTGSNVLPRVYAGLGPG